MSDADHFGPLLLGGTHNNKGPVILAQSCAVSYLDSLTYKYLFTIPAGSRIIGFTFYISSTFTTPGINLTAQLVCCAGPSITASLASLNSTNSDLLTGVVNAVQASVLGPTSSYSTPVFTPGDAANAALWANVGSTDMPVYVYLYNYYDDGTNPPSNVAYTTGAGVVTVTYALRKSDGTLRQLDY